MWWTIDSTKGWRPWTFGYGKSCGWRWLKLGPVAFTYGPFFGDVRYEVHVWLRCFELWRHTESPTAKVR